MKEKFLSAALLVLTSLAWAQSPSVEEKRINDLSKRKFDWLVSSQHDSLSVLLDENLQYIHSNGWIQSKREVLEDLKNGKLTYQKITVKDSKARLYGSSAIVTGTGTIDGTMEGQPFVINLCYTEVYVKNGSRWKLASRHANRMP